VYIGVEVGHRFAHLACHRILRYTHTNFGRPLIPKATALSSLISTIQNYGSVTACLYYLCYKWYKKVFNSLFIRFVEAIGLSRLLWERLYTI